MSVNINNYNSQFGLRGWLCAGCHQESRYHLFDMPVAALKEDLIQQAENDHYDRTFARCNSRKLRVIIARVYTED